ncbi:MAG: ABC transporter ATP-binding protein [Firmicutes bacterium]|nr:ABC transporter ATP-binding protein [Bacillota bacterium]
MLQIKDLCVSYGKVEALHKVSLNIKEGEIVCIIGSNGAGKTTTLNTISGLNTRSAGSITFKGEELPSNPSQIAKQGIIQIPEGRKIFPSLSVKENLLLGAYTLPRAKIKGLMANVFDLFPRLAERQNQRGGTLSGGEQQMLAIGRGLMAEPKLMLLDEPSLGLAPLIVKEIFDFLKQRNKDTGLTMLIVEQNAKVALRIADRAYILETGNIVMEGNAKDLASDPKVVEAYFGGAK